MRLICPNCDAQYEVSDDAIPAEGRDVQCSNCGHGWFQRPSAIFAARSAPGNEHALSDYADRPADPAGEPAPAESRPAAGFDPASPAPLPEGAEDDEAETDAAVAPLAVAPPSRSLDQGLLAMLREEAEREAEQRRQEGAGTTAPPDPQPVLPEIAAFHPAPPAHQPPPMAEPMPRPRRDLLPDIEEINSTLRSAAARPKDREEPAPVPPKPSRARYRAGFFLMILTALLLATGYLMAPRIAVEMPGAEPALRSYVTAVDQARLLLDRLLQAALQALKDAA